MRDFICTDRAEIFAPALLMVCLTADGDVIERALMEAILFWQSSSDLFAWEDTGEQKDRKMTHRSTVNSLSFVDLTRGVRNCMVKAAICCPKTRATLYVRGFTKSTQNSNIFSATSFGDISPRSSAPTSDDHAALAFRGSIQKQEQTRK